jgi:hypothetical protein
MSAVSQRIKAQIPGTRSLFPSFPVSPTLANLPSSYLELTLYSLLVGSDSVGVVYPATLSNYLGSESAGASAMANAVNQYSAFALLLVASLTDRE